LPFIYIVGRHVTLIAYHQMARMCHLELARGHVTIPTPLLIQYSHGKGPDDLVVVSRLDQTSRMP
jgi:hypothetical protein